MSLPNFFIIGAAKAGTTSLHHYLDQHPEIQMAANKEPRFFAGPEAGIPYPPDRVDRREDYESLFDPSFEVRGEASTDYAAHPRRIGAPARIRELVPEAKFVYLVRDPLARTISHYRMGVALMGERRSLRDATGDLAELRSPYLASSFYATQLRLYHEQFAAERVLVVDQTDLLGERRRTLAEIFAFLGVADAGEAVRSDEELLSASEWRTYSPRYLDFSNRFLVPASRWIPRRLRSSLRRRADRLLFPPLETPALDAETRAGLERLFRPEVEALREMTGKEFASWSL